MSGKMFLRKKKELKRAGVQAYSVPIMEYQNGKEKRKRKEKKKSSMIWYNLVKKCLNFC